MKRQRLGSKALPIKVEESSQEYSQDLLEMVEVSQEVVDLEVDVQVLEVKASQESKVDVEISAEMWKSIIAHWAVCLAYVAQVVQIALQAKGV